MGLGDEGEGEEKDVYMNRIGSRCVEGQKMHKTYM